jgi:hypothetical protein
LVPSQVWFDPVHASVQGPDPQFIVMFLQLWLLEQTVVQL